jgi:hypothetical protein
VLDEPVVAEDAEDRLGVAHVDREQHGFAPGLLPIDS